MSKVLHTEGPCLTWILGLEKTHYEKFALVDCRGSPTNAKIPHFHVHKSQIAVVGYAVVKTAYVGDPLYQ